MNMSTKSERKELTESLKQSLKPFGWKKSEYLFYRQVNRDTFVSSSGWDHSLDVTNKKFSISAKIHNRTLNKISWNVYGIDEDIDKPHMHVRSAFQCGLYFTQQSKEISYDGKIPCEIAQEMNDFIERYSLQYASIQRLDKQAPQDGKWFDAVNTLDALFCIKYAMGDIEAAKGYIEMEKRKPLFVQTPTAFVGRFLDRAEQCLKKQGCWL